MSDRTEKLHEIYEAHKDDCCGLFHTTLWNVMVNESCTGAFIPLLATNDGTTIALGVAQEDGGYIPTPTRIRKDEISRICDDLNEQVFGLTPKGATEVIAASFRNNAA